MVIYFNLLDILREVMMNTLSFISLILNILLIFYLRGLHKRNIYKVRSPIQMFLDKLLGGNK